MAKKNTARRMTAFRCAEPLLTEFQTWLTSQHMDMSPLLESWVTAFMLIPKEQRAGVLAGGGLPTLRPVNEKLIEVGETPESARTYNPNAEYGELLDIAGRLLRHPKPGLADTLRSSLVQLNDLARFWDGLQGIEDPPARKDQPGGDESGGAGLDALERAAEEDERELREPLRSGTNPPGKARRDRKKDSSGG